MCTLEKIGNFFILTLIDDNHKHHLGLHLIDSLLSTISQVNTQSINGSSTLITVTRSKFFCNSLDVPWGQPSAHLCLHQMVKSIKSVIAALLSFPIPTIAAVSSHAAVGGLVLALGHDYVLMRCDRGFMYTSEVDLAMTLPDYFSALVRSKIGRSSAQYDVLLRGMKVKGEKVVRIGIMDLAAHDSEKSVVEAVMCLGEW